MTPEQFCYWLQGLMETRDPNINISQRQIKSIEDHLNLVFEKKTPKVEPVKFPDFPLPDARPMFPEPYYQPYKPFSDRITC